MTVFLPEDFMALWLMLSALIYFAYLFIQAIADKQVRDMIWSNMMDRLKHDTTQLRESLSALITKALYGNLCSTTSLELQRIRTILSELESELDPDSIANSETMTQSQQLIEFDPDSIANSETMTQSQQLIEFDTDSIANSETMTQSQQLIELDFLTAQAMLFSSKPIHIAQGETMPQSNHDTLPAMESDFQWHLVNDFDEWKDTLPFMKRNHSHRLKTRVLVDIMTWFLSKETMKSDGMYFHDSPMRREIHVKRTAALQQPFDAQPLALFKIICEHMLMTRLTYEFSQSQEYCTCCGMPVKWEYCRENAVWYQCHTVL